MKKQYKAELAILMISAIWGSSFILMKNLLDHMPVFSYLSIRFILASFIMLLLFGSHLKGIDKKTLILGILTGLMLFGGMSLQVFGLQFTTASKSAFITGLNVVLVPVIASVFLKKKPPIPSLIGVILAATGLYFITGGSIDSLNLGDLLTLFCAVCFALQIIIIDYSVSKTDVAALAVIQITTAAAACTILWIFTDNPAPNFTGGVVFTILITGIFGTALAFGAQTVAQKYTSPTRTALILTCEPVFAAIFAITIPNNQGSTESLTIPLITGCLLILSGMIIASLRISSAKTKKNAHKNEDISLTVSDF